ncbi:hypothetical protein D3C78_1551800 [compost metagenome]
MPTVKLPSMPPICSNEPSSAASPMLRPASRVSSGSQLDSKYMVSKPMNSVIQIMQVPRL